MNWLVGVALGYAGGAGFTALVVFRPETSIASWPLPLRLSMVVLWPVTWFLALVLWLVIKLIEWGDR